MIELIKDVALALTTGTAALAGGASSTFSSFTPLPWDHNPNQFHEEAGKSSVSGQGVTSAASLNLCFGMTGSFHKMLTDMSEGGECIGASIRSS